MKKITVMVLVLTLVWLLTACGMQTAHPMEAWRDDVARSVAARLMLPDGSETTVDSEIASLRTLADMDIHESPMEPADGEDDWLYRIVYDPSEKTVGGNETVVSFHREYVQIGSEYCLPAEGVSYESILRWAEGKFAYFMP